MSLADIRYSEEAHLYPSDALDGLQSCLAGFCAGFLGRQDCVWIAEAGLDAVAVDIDPERLAEMRPLYPAGWEFVEADVFEYARQRYAQGARFDVVNLDPPTNLFDRCADDADLWCSLARRIVILGVGRHTELDVPVGWELLNVTKRSRFEGGTYWTVLGRT